MNICIFAHWKMHVHHRIRCVNCTLCYYRLHYASSRQLGRQQTRCRPRPIFVRDTTHMITINKDDSLVRAAVYVL